MGNPLLSRRAALELVLCGAGLAGLGPTAVEARSSAQAHRPKLELPFLAENPTAVPVRVSVEHPMERDHFIRSIQITLETDPVPHKGMYRFTPANGQAWVAFPMRSGDGGLLKATAECSKHGRFVATRDFRVAGDGCATTPYTIDRNAAGSPRLRVPRRARVSEVVEVLAKLDHDSDTGLSLKGDKYVRERPEFFIKQMQVYLDRLLVSEFRLTSAVSPNPIIRFPLRVSGAGTLRVVFVNNEGRRWEVTESIEAIR